jgi:hypothetical protein
VIGSSAAACKRRKERGTPAKSPALSQEREKAGHPHFGVR